jgi:sugar phosphate isomerase/epimerase
MSGFWHRGIMISQIWPDACCHHGATMGAMSRVLDTGFFQAIQTVHIDSGRERRLVRDRIEAEGIELTYCIARRFSKEKLNLSSLDEAVRRHSCAEAIRALAEARECGATRMSFVSGPNSPQSGTRGKGLAALLRSFEEIAVQAMSDPVVVPVIEPLDIEADKRGTLGTVEEAARICRELRKLGLTAMVCADTAHMILNGEDPVTATVSCGDLLAEFHLSNPVLFAQDTLYGDRHIPFGLPGALMSHDLSRIVRMAGEQLRKVTHRIPLFLEVMNQQRNDAAAAETLLNYNIDMLRELTGDDL